MPNINNLTQYSQVAKKAYLIILEKKLNNFELAYLEAADEIIKSAESRKKGCPKKAFVGICQSGILKDIPSKGTLRSDNKNYLYVRYAINKWIKNPEISKKEMWGMVKKEFHKPSLKHQQQLDIVEGIWEYIIKQNQPL